MTVSLAGPFAGAIHDQNMFDQSGILANLHECLDFPEMEETYAIYGDPAYREDRCIVKPFRTGSDCMIQFDKLHIY